MTDKPEHENQFDDKTRTHMVLSKGTMVLHYRIVEKIGAGGMGEVFLAEDTRLKRQVSLKFLPLDLISNDQIRPRFVREAQILARLNHPNIVGIYDVNEFQGRPFYAMEWIEGKTVQYYCHKEPLPIETVIEYAIQICQGLAEAHRAGIIHRDIKSTNIIIDKRVGAHLIDFGLAKHERDDKLTKTGSTLGTIAYMSPEQVSGREADHRSDLFSFGIVLYELLAGRTPFQRDNEGATLKAIMEDEPEPISRYKAGVPEQLQALIRKLLEKNKELRYQSAEGVIADLKKLAYNSQSMARLAVIRRPLYKRPVTYTVLVLLAILAVLGQHLLRPGSDRPSDNKPVLAVLPFINIGSDEDLYFSEGITDEIRSSLNSLEGVRILSRNSVEKYRGTDKTPEEIGQELHIDYLLEGTIRWDKSSEIERLRITPQLTQTKNGYQLWSDSYERTVKGIFEVQSEIAGQIARELGVTLQSGEPVYSGSSQTDNLDAFNYYLKGLDITRQGVFDNIKTRKAMAYFDSAIALDSSFALAWAQKSRAASEFAFGYLGNGDTLWLTAKLAAKKSLELQPNLVEGHIALGSFYNWGEQDFDLALAEFSKASGETGTSADLAEAVGVVRMRQGEWRAAIAKFEEAAHLDPLNTRRYYWLANCNAELRDFEKANQYINRSFALAPNNDDAIWLKVFINLLRSGKVEAGEYKYSNFTDVVGVALASTFKLSLANTFGLWRFLPREYITEDVFTGLEPLKEKLPYFAYLCNVGELYTLMDKPEIGRVYLDSARTILKQAYQDNPHDFHIAGQLAVVYARLGNYDEAIAVGKEAKELMSVDDCHW